MVSSPPAPEDSGFATPAAVVISLAVATIAIAVESRAMQEVHLAEADYARTAAELRLDGVQRLAVGALYGGEGLTLPQATVELEGQAVTVRAEVDAAKLPLASAAALSGDTLAALGASQPAAVQQGLQRLAAAPSVAPDEVADLDPSARWRRCALSWISPYGGALTPAGPMPAASRAEAHVGEIWRVVATTSDGWTDDRSVRITGEEHVPSRTLDRSLYRQTPGARPCPDLAARPPAAPARTATP